MVIEGMTRDEIFDYWGCDYFKDLDLNDYIDFAQRVVGDNGYCPGGLKFAKTWEEASEDEEKYLVEMRELYESEKDKKYSPYDGKHGEVIVLTAEDVAMIERTGGFGNEKV